MKNKTYRNITNIILTLVGITCSISVAIAQGIDNHLLSPKEIFEQDQETNADLMNDINYLYDNWYCIQDKEALIEKLIIDSNAPIISEYLQLIKSFYYLEKSMPKKAVSVLNDVEFNQLNGNNKYLRGRIFFQLNNYTRALENFNQADQILKENRNYIGQVYIKNSLIQVFGRIQNYDESYKYYIEGITLCERIGFDMGLFIIYRSYGNVINESDIESSHEILSKGWELVKLEDSVLWKVKYAVSYLRFLLRNSMFKEFTRVYNEVKSNYFENCLYLEWSSIETLYAHKMALDNKIDSSLYYDRKALKLRKKTGNQFFIGYSYLNIFNSLLQKKNFSDAKMNLDTAKTFLYNKGNIVTKRYYLQYLIKYHNNIYATNDTLQPIYQELLELNTNFFEDQQNTYVSKIQEENEINLNLQKEKYEIVLKSRQIRIWYISIIAILLLIISIGLFFLLKDKSKRFNRLRMKFKKSFLTLSDYKREIKQLKNIFENSITGFFILNTDGKIKFVNKKGEQLFGEGSTGLMDQSFSKYFNEADLLLVSSTIKAVAENFEDKELEIDISKLSNSRKVISLSFSPMIINEVLESILVIALDVTGKIRALELEKEQANVLQTLFNSITESILLLDGDFNVKHINNTGARRLGKTVDEVIGVPYFNILPEPLLKTRKEKLQQSIDEKNPVVYSEDIDSYNTMISYFPSFNADGSIAYVAEFAQDITERRLAHEQINSLRQKVLRSQMNPHFIFNSLNAIQSYVLKNEAANAVKYLSSFAKLIRMILDSSRFDYINLSKEINILEYYLDLQQLRFGERFSYKLDIDPEIDLELVLIPAMLAQPFIENSIEHGLQYSAKPGLVQISFEKAKDHIVFKVVDNGIGREASQKLQQDNLHKSKSLSTQLFKERLFTLNKFSGKKINYDIVDLKGDQGEAKGTMVIINLPIMYRHNAL